jgi:ubiquitin-protein ligase
MASSASKRLFKEYKSLSSDPPEGITAGPVSEDDMFLWEALIQGPEGTPFEGGIFPAELRFPKDYPLAPPKMKFVTDVWHPNGTLGRLMSDLDLDKEFGMSANTVLCSLSKWRSLHIDLTSSRRRSAPVRTGERALVADSKRREDID